MEARQPSESNYSLPIGLRYNLGIADSVPAVRNISQYLSSNATTFSGTGTNVCRIPVSSGNFLDLKNALLQFEFEADGNIVQFDGSVAGIIEEINITAGGQTIETIRGYGQLDAILDQYSSSDSVLRQNAVLKGGIKQIDETASFVAVAGTSGNAALVATASSESFNTGIKVTSKNTYTGNTGQTTVTLEGAGGIGYDQAQTQVLNAGIKRKYSFALKACGFFNPATNKLMPPNTPFMVSIQFAPGQNCLVNKSSTTAAAAYKVAECELHIPEIQILDPAFMSRMQARMAQGLAWKCNSYDHFVNTMAGSTGNTTVQISARARSLKGLMTVLRLQSNVSNVDAFKLSKRSIQYVSDFCYRIGSSQYPSQKCDIVTADTYAAGGTAAGTRVTLATDGDLNVGEAYSHVLRLTGNLNTAGAHNLISEESFAQSELNNGTGILAMDLSAFADGSVNSGLNTLNNMPVSLEVNRTAAANGVIQTDTYSIHELVIIRDASGQLSSVY